MTTVLVAGATGMLGSAIASHLLEQPDVAVRLLIRQTALDDSAKRADIDRLVTAGAVIAVGDLSDRASLDAATARVDTVISAVQGRREIMVDGQIALATAAAANGVRRFIPSDFALNLFDAPAGAPQFALRREADAAIDGMDLEVVHILNGAFMDMMLDPNTAGIVDLSTDTARLWGTGDEPFNLTTVDDTARFTALVATDPADLGGIRMISGAQTTFNTIIADTEALIGRPVTKNVMGSADDLRQITSNADDPWSVIMPWYFLSMITVPPFAQTENERYPELHLTGLDEYLAGAHAAHRAG